jgi:hypothetical protein
LLGCSSSAAHPAAGLGERFGFSGTAGAGLIIAAGTDHVLLVKPTHRDDRSLPGGYLDAAAAASSAQARSSIARLACRTSSR